MNEWYLAIAILSLVVAVVAEIDISLHRRDHDRRRNARRSGDAK